MATTDERKLMLTALAKIFDKTATRCATAEHAALMLDRDLAHAGYAIVPIKTASVQELPTTFVQIGKASAALVDKLRRDRMEAARG